MQRARDMSRKQFEKALRDNGFETDHFMGYWRKNGISVSEYNADTRRAALAYILNTYDRLESERERVK